MKKISLFLAVFSSLLGFGITVSANTAPTRWEGVSSTGVITSDGDCPLQVTKEELTFHLNDIDDTDKFAKQGSLTASYSFYNPSEDTVHAHLLFPFDVSWYYSSHPESVLSDYKIKVGEEEIEKTLRYVYGDFYDFNTVDFLSHYSDTMFSNEELNPNTPVYRYEFAVNTSETESVGAIFSCSYDDSKWILPEVDFEYQDGNCTCDMRFFSGETCYAYFIGEDRSAEFMASAKLYKDDSNVDGSVYAAKKQELTLKTFFNSFHSSSDGISETDWYNGCFFNFTQNVPVTLSALRSTGKNMIMAYSYDLTVAPGETVINEVNAPLFPSGDSAGYTFHYLLTPAKAWSSFSDLTIKIETDRELTSSTLDFEKTDGGYILNSASLPDKDLTFEIGTSGNSGTIARWILITGGVILVGVCIVVLVVELKKSKKKLPAEKTTENENVTPFEEKEDFKE